MGCGQSSTSPVPVVATTQEQKAMNDEIENALKKELDDEKKIIKILLLGAGECGKSTILKQMKILHMNGFTDEEKEEYVDLCRRNTLDGIKSLIQGCLDLGIPFQSPSNQKTAMEINEIRTADVNQHLGRIDDIKALWLDTGIKEAVTKSNQFHFLDSAPYFLKDDVIKRTFSSSYAPTTQDILRARLTTTGIIETIFSMDGLDFKMYDVGGQRGERKKWIHCFDDVTAIMFITALSEYDMVLAEDRNKNRMEESLDLFEGICEMDWFLNSAIILFLNKKDLFEEKVARVHIGDYIDRYEGAKYDYQEGLDFIRNEYLDCATEDPDRSESNVYTHVTDATNTENVRFVWKAARQIIMEKQLTRGGLNMC